MKNKLIILVLLALCATAFAYVSCNKQGLDSNSSSKKEQTKANKNSAFTRNVISRIIGSSNSEILRMAEDVNQFDQEVSIIDNPNFGRFSATPQYDIFLGGFTDPNVKLRLNDVEYNPSNDNGNWSNQNIKFKDYFGKTVTVELYDGQKSAKETLYFPKSILAKKLGPVYNSIEISRTGNKLEWEPDGQNVSKKVLLYYTTYDNDIPVSNEGEIKREFLILDDNGGFPLDEILANAKIKRIAFSLVRGNTMSFTSGSGKKVLFTMRCVDSHEYVLGDN